MKQIEPSTSSQVIEEIIRSDKLQEKRIGSELCIC